MKIENKLKIYLSTDFLQNTCLVYYFNTTFIKNALCTLNEKNA